MLIKDGGVTKAVPLRFIVLGSLSILLILGIVTLMRMITRNEHTDKCKRGLDVIRQVFKDRFDDDAMLVNYYPIEAPDLKAPDFERPQIVEAKGEAKKNRRPWWRPYAKNALPRRFGGLSHTTAVVNSLIAGAIIGVALYRRTDPGVIGAASGVAIVVFFIQLAYIAYRESKATDKLRMGDPTHAGGVVFRKVNGTVEYLLVSAENNPQEFVLPKGHIKPGEGHAEAALREVREETGAVVRLVGLVASDVLFAVPNEQVNAKFYLMEFLYQQQNEKKTDERESLWCSLDKANDSLKHPESRYVLLCAEKKRVALFAS